MQLPQLRFLQWLAYLIELCYDSGNRPLTLNPLWVKFSPTPAVTHTHTGLANLVRQTHTPFCFIDGLDELTLFWQDAFYVLHQGALKFSLFYQTSARWWCEMSIIISVRWGWWPHIVESLHFFFHLLRPSPIMFDRSWSHLDRWIINHKDTSWSQNQCAMKTFVLHFNTFNGTLMSAPGKLCGATSPPANQVGQPDQPDLKFVNF